MFRLHSRLCAILASAGAILPLATSFAGDAINYRQPESRIVSGMDGQKVVKTIAPLVLSPELQVVVDKSRLLLAPEVDLQGESFVAGNADSALSLEIQGQLAFRSLPGSGSSEEVAERIKMVPGTADLGIGTKFGAFMPREDPKAGALGVYLRVAANIAYQSADVSGQPRAEFVMFTPEASANVYLVYALIGYKIKYFGAVGRSPTGLDTTLLGQFSHSFRATTSFDIAGKTQFVQLNYMLPPPGSESWGTLSLSYSSALELL